MIIFSKKYTEDIEKLRVTMDCLRADARIIVLEDDAFLPKGISSPLEYYISKQNYEEHVERELFYDSLPVPEYWEIYLEGTSAEVYNLGHKRGTIYFCGRSSRRTDSKLGMDNASKVIDLPESAGNADSMEMVKKGVVERVEWYMENGWIYRVDFYNKYGLKYASEFRDVDGNVESRVFYSDKNQEVIIEYPGNDVIALLENGMVKAFFNSRAEFIKYYIAEVAAEENRIFFVQDDSMLESLSIKPDEEQAWEYVLFPNDDLLNKYMDMGGKNGIRFYAIPEHYPENKGKGEALILTNSDQIEKLEELTQELPDVTFHIAANTLVSDKLKEIGKQENVNIYPCVSQEVLDKLWDRCDFYLDINHWNEIRDAVNVAHQKNLLIMGFENTLHHKELLVEGCIYQAQEYKKMVLVVKYILKSLELMQKLLLVQQRKKKDIWKSFLKSMKNVEGEGNKNL